MPKKVFSEKDYNSSNGMSTGIWGPLIWSSLHIISFNYPVAPTYADKKNYKTWLLSFEKTLPCCYCRNNFRKNLKSAGFNDKVFDSRDSFSRFIYKLHNCVNVMLGKKIFFNYEYVRDLYENFRSGCSEKEKTEFIKLNNSNKLEKNCNSSLYGVKSRSMIKIVPNNIKGNSIIVDKACKKK